MADKAFFLLTDITGYTSFLTSSELTHAQHIIEELFKSQLEILKPPLTVSNFQGDAILCYASANPSAWPVESILDRVGRLYNAFSKKIEAMQVNPPCSCNACSTMDVLDIKIFLHYGEYMLKEIGDRKELMGADLIVAHRMMKNNVLEKTGIKSYFLASRSALDEIADGKKDKIGFMDYDESYEHIGKVQMKVAPLSDLL